MKTSSSHEGGAVPILIGLTVIVVLVARRTRGALLDYRRLMLSPLIVIAVGAAAFLPGLVSIHLLGVDYTVLALDVLSSIVLGAMRGVTVLIYLHEGATWYRYPPLTVALWAVSVLVRAALGLAGRYEGASAVITANGVLLMLGLSLLIQNLFVRARGRNHRSTGAAPRRTWSTIGPHRPSHSPPR